MLLISKFLLGSEIYEVPPIADGQVVGGKLTALVRFVSGLFTWGIAKPARSESATTPIAIKRYLCCSIILGI